MTPIEIYAPAGPTAAPPLALAAMPDRLDGKRLLVLDNGKPHAALVMGRIAERLASRTGLDFRGVRRKGSAANPCEAELLASLVRDADLLITGSAD